MRGNYKIQSRTAPPTEMETVHEASPMVASRQYAFTLEEKLQAFTNLALLWAPHLAAAEHVLVSWLLANTVGRGNRSGCYSLPQLVDGVPKADGSGMWTHGTGMSEPTVRRTIASARAKGVIHTTKDRRGTRFAVVLNWNPATGTAQETNLVALNLPRAARRATSTPVNHVQAAAEPDFDADWGDQNDHSGVIKMITPPCQNDHPSIEKPTNQETLQEKGSEDAASRRLALLPVRKRVRPASPVQSQTHQPSITGEEEPSPHCAPPPPAEPVRFDLRSNVANAIKAANALRSKRIADARKRNDTDAWATTWAAAWAEANPGVACPAWSQKRAGMLKKSLKANWPKWEDGRVHDFLHWTVTNWDVILGAKLAWMQRSPPPAMPCIEFVVHFMRNFQEAWAEREELRWRGTQDGVKQEAIALVKREGVTIEVATARVIAMHASMRDRKAVAELSARAARDARIAMRAADRAGATRFTKENPHPRAHENVHGPIAMVDGEPDWAAMSKPLVFNEDAL